MAERGSVARAARLAVATREGAADAPWLSAAMRATLEPGPDGGSVLAQARWLADIGEELGGVVSLSGGTIEDLLPPDFVREAARQAVERYPHYPGVKGYRDLRVAIAGKLARDNGITADPEAEILPTIGLQQVIDSVCRILLDPGDEVLVFDPEYASTHPPIQMTGARIVPVPLAYADGEWRFDFEALASRASRRTKLLIFSNPNNPTGIVLSRPELEAIADLARTLGFWIFADEEYEHTLFEGAQHCSIASLPGMGERTVTGYSFSKPFAMTAYRIGYAVGPARFTDHLHTILRASIQACSAVGMRAAHAVLTGDMSAWLGEKMALLNAKRSYAVERLNAMPGVRCNRPRGVYFLFPRVAREGLSSFALAEHVLQAGRVGVAPGSQFGRMGETHLRISFCPSMATLVEGLDRFERALEAL